MKNLMPLLITCDRRPWPTLTLNPLVTLALLALALSACHPQPTPSPSPLPSSIPSPVVSPIPEPVPSVTVTPTPTPTVTPTVTPAPTPIPSGTPIAKGLIGSNLAAIKSYEPDLLFTQAFHKARPWIAGGCDGTWDTGTALTLDGNLYLVALPLGICPHTVFLDGNKHPTGTYTVKWDGAGTLGVRMDGSNWKQVGPGSATFDVGATTAGIDLMIKTLPVTNLRVYLPGFDGVDAFYPQSLALMAPYSAIRFMDWLQTNGSQLKHWTDRPQIGDAMYTTARGAPIELAINLLNKLHVDGWFNVPHQADDDYVNQMAALIKAQLDPGLKVYVEYSNETWNGQFPQAAYVTAQGAATGLPGLNDYEKGRMFQAVRTMEVGAIFKKTLGTRAIVVLGSQMASPYWSGKMLAYLKTKGLKPDAVAAANYMGGAIDSADVSAWTLDQLFNQLTTVELPKAIADAKAHRVVTDQYGVRLLAYEGGSHLVGVGALQNNQKITDLYLAAAADPRMGVAYTTLLSAWKQNVGDLFMHFSHLGQWTKFGSWGARRTMEDTTPKYEALKK